MCKSHCASSLTIPINMIDVIRFVNSRFSSNTYILSHSEFESVWVVDPGDITPIFQWLSCHKKEQVTGILLTHAHFDHIYGINDILSIYPSCSIYVCNEYGKELLFNAKKNASRYSEFGEFIVKENASIRYIPPLLPLWPDTELKAFHTPGHSPDSVCLLVNKLLFTGDTLIKDTRTVTKLKGGSVDDLHHSIQILSNLKKRGLTVLPGHDESFKLDGYDLNTAERNVLIYQ